VTAPQGGTEAEVRSGSRRQSVRKARTICYHGAVPQAGYSGADVARFLGVTPSAVHRAVEGKPKATETC
jgi:hypothetical protein